MQQFKNFKIKFTILNIHFCWVIVSGPLEKEGYQLWLVKLLHNKTKLNCYQTSQGKLTCEILCFKIAYRTSKFAIWSSLSLQFTKPFSHCFLEKLVELWCWTLLTLCSSWKQRFSHTKVQFMKHYHTSHFTECPLLCPVYHKKGV